MRDVCFIADVAVLPRWIRVAQALDYVAGVHPRFDRAKAEALPRARPRIKPHQRVRELSKGMVAQLHLALVMAIDARLLVLDEPTLGLDLLYRKQFYDTLLDDYFDEQPHHRRDHPPGRGDRAHPDRRDVHRPRPASCSTAAWRTFEARYAEVHGAARAARRGARAEADPRAAGVRPERSCCSTASTAQRLAALGEVRTPSIADLFVAVVGGQAAAGGAAR